MNSIRFVLAGMVLVGLGVVLGWSAKPVEAQADTPTYVYEMRTYTTEPGRLPALHARFRDHTMKLFEKHGMKNVIYLTPVDAQGKAIDNKLVYLLAHKSQAAAKASFASFAQDPDWKAAAAASEKDGKIVVKGGVESQFLVPTDYSPMK